MSLSLTHRLYRAGLGALEAGIGLISRDAWLKLAANAVSAMNLMREVNTGKGVIRFWCDSETARIRAREMLVREPDTLRWIETMTPSDVLLDIGSNVGVFSLYAAVVAGARVIAIDPLPFNYAALVRNAALNGVTDRIMPFCIAAADTTRVADLHVSREAATSGGAECPFDSPLDNEGHAIEPAFRLSTMGFALDDLFETFRLPPSTYLKLDIDGPPEAVLAGGRRVLSNPALRHAMCEIRPGRETFDRFVAAMRSFGFEHERTAANSPNARADVTLFNTNNFFVKRAEPDVVTPAQPHTH